MKNLFKLLPGSVDDLTYVVREIRALIGRVFKLIEMKKIITLFTILFVLISCRKETSYSGNCGTIKNKIHEGQPSWEPPRNEIWAIAVSVTDSTERWVGVDSATWNKINIGDKYCQ